MLFIPLKINLRGTFETAIAAAKAAIEKGIATDEPAVIDDNFYTAQCEHTLPVLMPRLVEALA